MTLVSLKKKKKKKAVCLVYAWCPKEEGTGGPKTEGTDGFKMPYDNGAQI